MNKLYDLLHFGVTAIFSIPVWAWLILGIILIGSIQPYDDTDDANSNIRSGMSLKTDHSTGCQYLGSILGGYTPRLNTDGKHMGCRNE